MIVSSAYLLHPRPPCTYSGRADNACTNLLGFFVCYVRTRGMVEISESAKPPTFTLSFAARTRHAWLARLTRARRRWFGRRTARVLLADFCYFWSYKSTIKEKLLYVSTAAASHRPTHKAQAQSTDKVKDMLSIPSTHSLYSRPRHPLSSGRAGLRARICSAFSCAMFARVV